MDSTTNWPWVDLFWIETKEVIESTEKNTKTEIQMGHSGICLSLRYYNVEIALSKFIVVFLVTWVSQVNFRFDQTIV